MRSLQQKIFKFYCVSSLILLPNVCFSSAQIIVKNFCDQPVSLHASDDIECEPSGIEIAKKRQIRLLQVNSGMIEVCTPMNDNGQSSYFVHPEQQETPRELSSEVIDLPEGGKLSWYCSNSGSTGPCECASDEQSI